VPPTIEQVIAAIPDWAGRSVTAERIPAGLTNTNYRVEVDGTPFFVRIPGAGTDLLAVDRDFLGSFDGQPNAAAGNLQYLHSNVVANYDGLRLSPGEY
jgi:hypothetical protein